MFLNNVILLYRIIISMSYQSKYYKYKQKYLALKRQYYEPYPFFIVHGTTNLDTLTRILKSGKIKLGSQVRVKDRKFSGIASKPYIFSSMYFTDLKNFREAKGISLLLSSSLLDEYTGYFNKNWQGGPGSQSIKLDKNDDLVTRATKLNIIREFIKDPSELPWIVKKFPGDFHHELVFEEPLLIKKYLRGVVCYGCPKEIIDSLHEILEKKKYHLSKKNA